MSTLQAAQGALHKNPQEALEKVGTFLSNLPAGTSPNDQAVAYILRARALEKLHDFPSAREDVMALESLANGSNSSKPSITLHLNIPNPSNPTSTENKQFYHDWAARLVHKAQLTTGGGPAFKHVQAQDWNAVDKDLEPIIKQALDHKDYDSPMLVLAGYAALEKGDAEKAMQHSGTWLSHANTYKAPKALTSWAHAIRAKAGEMMGEPSGSIQDVMALNTLARDFNTTNAPAWTQHLKLKDNQGNVVDLTSQESLQAWGERLKTSAKSKH